MVLTSKSKPRFSLGTCSKILFLKIFEKYKFFRFQVAFRLTNIRKDQISTKKFDFQKKQVN